ncbi:IS66 family transposase [Ochrobactrum teleogrylli]|uniref:IS66 family transposase n=1 Tax=Ochrobactrum teleogrylli TaxID=2479765 RepID=UPI00384C8234
MMPPDLNLPDDVEALKAMVLAMADKAAWADALECEVTDLKARNADVDERIERLTQILKAFDRARFGRRSEKLGSPSTDDEQQAFVFEEIETGIAVIRAQVNKGGERPDGKRPPRPRKVFAPHLERVEVVIEPEELPEHAGKQKVLIGEDVSERLDVVPAKFRVIVTRRPKYAFKNEDGVIQAQAPAHIIESGIPTEALLAQIAVSYARDKVELDRQLMAQWMGKLGFELEILADYLFDEIKKAERIFADETTLPTLAPGSGSTKTAYLWAYARDDRPFGGSGSPMVAYRFEDSRAGECVARHLNGYRGILQVDGYAPTTSWSAPMAAMTASNWQAAGRPAGGSSMNCMSRKAQRSQRRRSSGWRSCGRSRRPCAAKALKPVSRYVSKPAIVTELFALWQKTLPRISGKSKLAEAIRYAISRRAIFERFLADERNELDSNIVERAIRPQAITRKNSLFAGSDGGGRSWATIATLLQTAKKNNVDPLAWLKQTLERIASGWPSSEIDALMPWNYAD